MRNRSYNCHNPAQGTFKKVLCVCSAGLLRSPTVALVLSQEPFNFNTRAVGIDSDYALIPLDDVLLEWADEIVCMDDSQARTIQLRTKKPIKVLHIEDSYDYRSPELIDAIKRKYTGISVWEVL